MADLRRSPLTRQQLAAFLPSHEAIRAFERISQAVGDNAQASDDAVALAQQAQTTASAAATTANAASVAAGVAQASADAAAAAVEDLEVAINQQYAWRYDADAKPPTVAYYGEAQPGAAEADPVWRIQRFDFGAVDGDVSGKWAGGEATFTHAWTGRAGLTYA